MALGWVSDNIESFGTKRNSNDAVNIVEFTGIVRIISVRTRTWIVYYSIVYYKSDNKRSNLGDGLLKWKL